MVERIVQRTIRFVALQVQDAIDCILHLPANVFLEVRHAHIVERDVIELQILYRLLVVMVLLLLRLMMMKLIMMMMILER